MKSTYKIIALFISMLISSSALSQSSTDALSTCMADNLNGKERKSLAKWIFFAIGAHPEIKSYLNVTQRDVRVSDKHVGALITRLLTVDCSDQLKMAYASDPTSAEKAFEVVGKVAMQELMANDEVNKAIGAYVQFADINKIEKILK